MYHPRAKPVQRPDTSIKGNQCDVTEPNPVTYLHIVRLARWFCRVLQKLLPPVLKMVRAATDTVDDYKAAYGNLGQQLHAAVVKLRQTSTPPTSGSATVCATSLLQSRPPGILTQQVRDSSHWLCAVLSIVLCCCLCVESIVCIECHLALYQWYNVWFVST